MKRIIKAYRFLRDDIAERVWNSLDKKFGIPNTPRALPMKLWDDDPDEYTWDDFHRESKEKYPIRYFIFNELDVHVSVFFKRYIEDPLYYIDSRFFEKHHLIDLRGGSVSTWEKEYQGGYIDPQHVLEIGMYKAFQRYLNELEVIEDGLDSKISSLEDYLKNTKNNDEVWVQESLDKLNQMREIRDFFDIEYKEMRQKEDSLWGGITEANNTRKDREPIYKSVSKLEKARIERTTEILVKMVKLREGLWT